jgi:rubrerythrin
LFTNIHNSSGYYGDYDRKLLDLLREAMSDESKDLRKYRMMMEMTDNQEIIEQIQHAYEDETKHYDMFQEIYEELSGSDIKILSPEQEHQNKLIDAVKSSINTELEAVELYREIRTMLHGKKYRNMMFEIISDEQEHATRLVYLYSMLR